MDFNKIYDANEAVIPQTAEVERAEEQASRIFDAVKALDPELAFELDTAFGAIALAYERKGFFGGLQVAEPEWRQGAA